MIAAVAPELYRNTWAEVDLAAIGSNVRHIKRQLPSAVKLMAVVKADGYGHGALETARVAVESGADSLAVAYLSEALTLRKQGVKLPILILIPIKPQEVPMAIEYDLMLTVTSAAWFKEMRRVCGHSFYPFMLNVHVKMDTGLGRIGIRDKQQWEAMVPWLEAADIEVEGMFTHFATAGDKDTGYLHTQFLRFREMMEWANNSPVHVKTFHCANSAAALRFPEMSLDMVRIGAAMYGFGPESIKNAARLESALSLHSSLIEVKHLKKGEYVGYDLAYRTDREEWIGTVPVGYADGWSQSLRHTELIVDGQRAPIIGKIGMDQMMIRLPREYPAGTKVTLIGRNGRESVTCMELAANLGGAAQEISTSISCRVTRVYSEE
ncbi:alanine racemase [Paenibacillus nasutitermitis]|uniref:Alanine racemase n=1 Tax=Paenibacillus nasutitermitis TaxID=1652958 RepID=A0A916YVN6_9BACL|nr:alanine racemase [Paenibacillus nasutitermitis]GGD63300.1 alanine racemase [Paenibacillus nasutitermitis]